MSDATTKLDPATLRWFAAQLAGARDRATDMGTDEHRYLYLAGAVAGLEAIATSIAKRRDGGTTAPACPPSPYSPPSRGAK